VLLTDVTEALPLLQRNAARVNAGLPDKSTLRVQDLLWGSEEAIARAGVGSFEVVFGADILYWLDTEGVEQLVRTLEQLLSADGTILLAYEFREDWETTGCFHETCEAVGLTSETVELYGSDPDEVVLFLIRRRVEAPGAAGGSST
jgi:hypothetical protein